MAARLKNHCLLLFFACGLSMVHCALDKIPQNLAAMCSPLDWHHCPDSQLALIMSTACGCHDVDKTYEFHCQEAKVAGQGQAERLEVACLPPVTCAVGTIPVVHKEQGSGGTQSAYVQCEQCASGYFEKQVNISSRHRYQTCQHPLQTCNERYGETLVRGGNSRHDTLCRCLTEQGFLPFPDTRRCSNLHGFDGESGCRCMSHSRHSHYVPGILSPDGAAVVDGGDLWFLGVGALAVMIASLLFYVVKVACFTKKDKAVYIPAPLEQEIDVPEP